MTTRPLALVTGASRGIGFELARQFAQHGFDLLVNAEDDDLAAAADRLRTDGAEVTAVQADLATDEGVEQVVAAVAGRPLAALALNAGIGRGGAFVDTPLEDELRLIALNVTSVVHLAKRLVPAMVERGEGRVLITSSVAATQPGAFQAVYNASKSFVQSFAQALQEELRKTPVTVTALMPGPTDTDFFARANLLGSRVGQGPKDDPADVARVGFEALMAGRHKVYAAGLTTKVMGLVGAVTPDRVKAFTHRLMAQPK